MLTGDDLAFVIPLWRRTTNVERVTDAVRLTTPAAEIVFVVSDLDVEPMCAVADLCAHDVMERLETGEHGHAGWIRPVVLPGKGGEQGDYARKINAGYRATDAPYIFTGADDIVPHHGWYDAARALMVDGIGVVGTVDHNNPRTERGDHSTHSLVARWYADYGACADQTQVIYHEGYWHEYCQPADASIWMADASFRPIDEVQVGDRVIGWERVPAGGMTLRAFTESEVLGVRERIAPVVRVTLESGRVVRCTEDHRWLNAAWSPSSTHDAEFVTPRVGRSLLHVVDEPEPIVDPREIRLAGWLAGIYDGEGSRVQIAQCPDHNPVVRDEIRDALTKLDVPFTETDKVWGFTLTGGRQGYLDFLLRIQPVRRDGLLEAILGGRADGTTRNRWGGRRFGERDRIIAVEADGIEPVFSLTTTTGNYVGQGYASRNCDDELVRTARQRTAYAHAFDAVVEHVHWHGDRSLDDQTYRHGRSRTGLSRRLFQQRRVLWGEMPRGGMPRQRAPRVVRRSR